MALVKITFNGALPAGDGFQHGWYADVDTGAHAIEDIAAAADAALEAFLTGDANLKGYYQAETTWGAPLVQTMNQVTGEVLDTLSGSFTGAGDHVGGVNLPGEVAACATFRTATLTPSGRGRSYLPAPGHVALANNGRFTDAFCQAVADAWAQCWTAFVSDGGGGTPAVWSNKTDSLYEITSVECGNVPDAQRSRRNGITETRFSTGWPA
jgi:hypothetical protein